MVNPETIQVPIGSLWTMVGYLFQKYHLGIQQPFSYSTTHLAIQQII